MEVRENVKISLYSLDWLRKQLLMDWVDGNIIYTVVNAIFEKEVYGFEPNMEKWNDIEKELYENYLEDNNIE